jgi:nucleoside 2-deoxyribosyltransferase
MRIKDSHRRLARKIFWSRHDRETYQCPDCDRTEAEAVREFEVHHKNGNTQDNRDENLIGLCRPCHNLREGKKPSVEEIRHLRSQAASEEDNEESSCDDSGNPSVYLAGSMDDDSSEHDVWRASVAERGDHGVYRYTGPTPITINSPTEVIGSHGCGYVDGIASADMKLLDESDAILAYFEKSDQIGTLTELVYAVSEGKPALVLFNKRLLGDYNSLHENGVDLHNECPTYWFLINFLTSQAWGDFRPSDITVRAVESRDEIKSEFMSWDWHIQKGHQIANVHKQKSANECSHEYTGFTTTADDTTVQVCQDCGQTLGKPTPPQND